jgi:hypothetical protein
MIQIAGEDHHRQRLARTFRAAFRASAVTGWALALTVAGWSTLWAEALNLVHGIPIVAAAAIFAVGLALIPVGVARPRRQPRPPRPAYPLAFGQPTLR